jgi:hypothetical protein
MNRVLIAAAVLLLFVAGCGSDGPVKSEDYGNILASPGTCSSSKTIVCDADADCPAGETCNGLILVEQEHPTGWMRAECFACHEASNIHQINRTGLPDDVVDLAGIRAITQDQGMASCPLCHGNNGVAP